MKDINPLICSPSPRDIKEFEDGMKTIKCDKLFAKYFVEYDAYQELTTYFKDHGEYTHMIIAPDDLIATNEHFSALKEDLEFQNFSILAGITTRDYNTDELSFYVSWHNIPSAVNSRMPDFMRWDGVERLKTQQNNPIIRVLNESFTFPFIRRDVIEKIPIKGLGEACPCCFDTIFSNDCSEQGVPQYVDTRVKMVHLKNRLNKTMNIGGNVISVMEEFHVGRKKPELRFEKA